MIGFSDTRIIDRKNGFVLSIDIYRVLFAFLVVFRHTYYLNTPNGESIFYGGYRSVEFFFILTGFLMAKTVDQKQPVKKSELGSETVGYLFRKFKHIFPCYLLCFFETFIVVQIIESPGIKLLLSRILFSWSELGFFQLWGGITQFYNSPTWYLSAAFVAILIIYPLLRINSDLFLKVIAPLLCIFIYGYLKNTFYYTSVTIEWSGVVCAGILRAVAGISCGCICFSVVKYLTGIKWKNIKILSAFFMVTEIILFSGIVFLAFLTKRSTYWELNNNMDFTTLLASSLLVISVFAREGIKPVKRDARIQNLCVLLENFSLSLYLSHRFVIYYVNYRMTGCMAYEMFLAYIAGSIVLTLVNMIITPIIAVIAKNLKNKIIINENK